MKQSGWGKIWDVLSPFVCILVCMFAATMIGTMGFGLISGVNGLDSELVLEMFPWLSLLISLICSILTVLVLRKTIQLDRARLGFDLHIWKPVHYAAAAFLGAAAGHIWSTLISLSGIGNVFTGYQETVSRAFEGQSIFLLIPATVIAAPIAEELVFRFLIYRRAKQYLGILPAAVISSAMFGIYHANMVQLIYVIGFSAVLLFVYEKSGNILAPVLAHAAANLWAVVMDTYLPETAVQSSVLMLGAELLISVAAVLFIMKKTA